MFADDKSEQRILKCSAIPASILLGRLSARQESSILLKSILGRYPFYLILYIIGPLLAPQACYLNLYWAVISPTGIQHSTQIYIGPLSAPQESNILLKSVLDRYRLDRNPAFYLNLYMTAIGQTGIQRST